MFGRARRGEPSFSPEEEAAYDAGIARIEEEKRAALLDPGPGWREWFLHDNARWWVGVGFLIVDSWDAVLWAQPLQWLLLLATLVPIVYAEYVVWHYLWHRPGDEAPMGRSFRPSWRRPFMYGRWTAEAARVRRGESPVPPHDGGPSPHEFL